MTWLRSLWTSSPARVDEDTYRQLRCGTALIMARGVGRGGLVLRPGGRRRGDGRFGGLRHGPAAGEASGAAVIAIGSESGHAPWIPDYRDLPADFFLRASRPKEG